MNLKFASTIALALGLVLSLAAQELKVDINNNNRPLSEGNDPAYTSWNDVTAWFPSGANSISKAFSGITVTFTRTGSVGTGLQPGYNKSFIQSPTLNVKLTADGIKVADGDAGAQIEMRISGLSAGSHTLAVYHNSWDSLASLAPLNVFVNGTQVLTNLPASINVTDNLAAGLSYLTFTATAGQDVVVLYAARTSGSEASKNVYINAFEIDTQNPKKLARNPSPSNADEHVNADAGSQTLSWASAWDGTAVSHDVYFGTSSNAVKNATHASPEFKGNQGGTNHLATNLNSLLTYYWRVDEVNNVWGATKGNLWYFRPRQLAFPGAEGYGRFARGGRGGVVVKVTNLNDSGAGSLRDAIEGNYGPRTVIFDVSGLITLNDDIIISGDMPYITVAGQTAPGKGICVKRQQFALSGSRDIICRFVRVRVGKESGETQNGSGMAGVDHCIMDHCSISWGIDEELSTRGGKNLSFQRSHISEALNVAGHQNYPAGTAHGYAASIGGDIASFHHNLLSHCEGRNWSLAGGLDANGYYAGRLDIFNNVVYNWGGRATDGGAHEVNFVNNYYKPGAATSQFIVLKPQYGGFPGTQQYYMVGNVEPGYFTTANQSAGFQLATENGGTLPQDSNPPYSALVGSPFFPSYATIDEVTNAYKKVLSDVGCTQPVVDDHDIRVIRETIDGTYTYTGSVSGKHGLPDTTADVGGWENYGNEVRPAHWDTDNDGMPNWWEVIKGFNTNSGVGNFSESNSDLDGDGFTALEDYLNWMAEPHTDCNAGGTVDIDLHSLSRGFTNSSPSYTFSNLVSGSVTLVSNRFARFTPTPSANALGSFLYKVTDNKGYNMTRPINIRVIGTGAAPTNAPATPTGLNATAGDAQVSLSWNFVLDATSYIVKRATVDGGPYTSIVTNASTSYVNTGLANGTTYYYVVSALNLIGESGNSGQVSATPQLALPATPTGLNATGGNTQVSLSWAAASGATSYIIKRATVSGGPYISIITNATTSYINTGLANGITYYYVVSATSGSGESPNSTQVSATPIGAISAGLLAYDDFSYTPASGIGGQTGGSGWAAAWQTTSGGQIGTNVAPGLTYGPLITSGGALQVGYPQPGVPTSSTTANPERVLPTTLGTLASTNGGVLWVSFLMYNPMYPTPPGKYYRQSNLGFFSGASGTTTAGSEVAALGSPNTSATVTTNFAAWGGTVTGSAPNMSAVPSFSTNVQLVLLKLVVDNTANLDSYYAWFNPTPALLGNNANTPDIGTANITNSGANLSSVNALRFQAGNYNSNGTNAFFTTDELRLGASFADVTPAAVVAPPNIAERIYALTTDNQLICFDSTTPGNILAAYTLSGLQAGEQIIGMDFWNGVLYGLGSQSRLYTINRNNGAAGFVGQFSPVLNGQAFGMDAEPGGLRVVSDLDQNLVLDYNTGAATVGTALGGSPNPGITGLAYHPLSGQRFGADYSQNTIGVLNPATGLVTTIGPAGIDFSRDNGFDISGNPGNTAYLASPASSSGAAANLYKVDLTTGSATLVGLVGLSGDDTLIRGLAVAPGYVNLDPTNLTCSTTGNQLTLLWPLDHIGWRLETQTNGAGAGLGTNWFTVPGSTSTNLMLIPTGGNTPASVFFRLVYP